MNQHEAISALLKRGDELTSAVNLINGNVQYLMQQIDSTNNRVENLTRTVGAHAGKLADLQNDIDLVDGTAQNAEREVCHAFERNESLACALDVNSITISELAARVTALELLPPAIPAPKPEAPVIAALREENRDLVARLCTLQEALRDGLPELRWYASRKVDLGKPPISSDQPWAENLKTDIEFLQKALDESRKDSVDYGRMDFSKAGTSWSAAEDQRLLHEHLVLNRTVANIARMHQRTRAGIEARLERLNQDKRRNA